MTAEEKDTTRDCKSDTWNYYHNGKLVRQGLATAHKGYPDLLYARIDGEGRVTVQENASQGKRPDKKLYLTTAGEVYRQCEDTTGNGKIDTETARQKRRRRRGSD